MTFLDEISLCKIPFNLTLGDGGFILWSDVLRNVFKGLSCQLPWRRYMAQFWELQLANRAIQRALMVITTTINMLLDPEHLPQDTALVNVMSPIFLPKL